MTQEPSVVPHRTEESNADNNNVIGGKGLNRTASKRLLE